MNQLSLNKQLIIGLGQGASKMELEASSSRKHRSIRNQERKVSACQKDKEFNLREVPVVKGELT